MMEYNSNFKPTLLLIVFICCNTASILYADSNSHNGSKRIEVYSLSQNFWDVQSGDTLSGIIQLLLPNNPTKHKPLQQDIVQLNPDAFIDNDPSLLIAGKRLWLPAYMKKPDTKADPATTSVEKFSWGNIKRQK